MSKGSSAPDPYATAQAQASANTQTAQATQNLNEYNQVTPIGNLTWTGSGNPNTPGGATSTITLSPQEQALLNSSLQGSQNLQTGVNSLIGDVNSSVGSMPSAPTLQGSPTLSNVSGTAAGLAPVNLQGLGSQLNTAQGVYGGAANSLSEALGNANNNMAGGLSYANTPGVPTLNQGTVNQQEAANFGNSMALLEPQLKQQDEQQANSLWSQGLVPGDEAYTNSENQYQAGRNNLLTQAANTATMSGLQAAEGLNNTQLGNQQQAVAQDNSLYTLPASTAAALASAYGTANNATSSLYGTTLQQGALNNTEAQTAYGDYVNANNINNNNAIEGTQLNNSAVQGNFQNNIGLQQQLLSALGSLRSGTAPGTPQFAGENTSTNVAQTPLSQDVYSSAALNSQANSALFGGLGSLGGSLLGAAGNSGSFSSLFG
jgi:hypothetical protein